MTIYRRWIGRIGKAWLRAAGPLLVTVILAWMLLDFVASSLRSVLADRMPSVRA